MTAAAPRGRLPVIGWCLYDWANSAYSAIVLSFVFAPYFLAHVAQDEVRGTVLWARAITVSGIVIGVASPVVGAFGDKGGRRRLWLAGFSALAIVATAMMWGVAPGPEHALLALVLLAVSNAGFELAYVFYNAMLPDVASEDRVGRVSGLGWALGYFGALAAMLIAWALLIEPDPPLFGFDGPSLEAVRATAPFAAAWFLVFAAPLVLYGPPERPSGLPARRVVREGLAELRATLRGLPRTPSIAWYLGAHMVYINGVSTLIVFGPLFAAGAFGFTASEVLIYGIAFYLVAGIGSLALGWLDDRVGAKPMVLLCLAAMTAMTAGVAATRDATLFWVLSMGIAFFLGPVQSVSRSLMVRLSPPETRTQLFGLYALAGRATGPLGPAALGGAVAEWGDQRAGAVVIGVLMALGLLMMLPVRERRSEDLRPPAPGEGADPVP